MGKPLINEATCQVCGVKFEANHFEVCLKCLYVIQKNYSTIFKMQPKQKRDIDQFGIILDSLISHNLFLKPSFKGNVGAFFGGYDGIGLISHFFGLNKIVVIDIDTEVLNWWQAIGNEYGFEVTPIQYDAIKPVPDGMLSFITDFKIDFWRTDPPFNCAGMFNFLSRIFYLNKKNAPIFLCAPTGNRWSQLMKHNVWKFILDSGLRISEVSPDLISYSHPEGPNSFTWKIVDGKIISLISNENYPYDIYRATKKFAESNLGCEQYERCKKRRDEWNGELKGKGGM